MRLDDFIIKNTDFFRNNTLDFRFQAHETASNLPITSQIIPPIIFQKHHHVQFVHPSYHSQQKDTYLMRTP